MDPNDLLKLLDLNAEPPPAANPAAPRQPEPAPAAGPTALEVDEWGLRRGRDLVAEGGRIRAAGADEFAAADFFAAAFDPDPRLLGGCADPRRHEFVRQLLETPEYRSLHADTRLDDTAAAIAAGHFAEQFAGLKKGEPGAAPPGAGELAGEVAALRAAGRAAAEARKEVGELRDAAAALGLGPGQPGSNDPRAIAELFRRVRGDPSLRRICELAGRFRRVAQSRQRVKSAHGLDDVVGVEPGGDVGRLLPAELARLAAPEFELDALRRIAERQALCRDQRIIRPVSEDAAAIRFQFTQESRSGDKFEYTLETMLTLDKQTGAVSCELPGLATLAQEELDRCIAVRTGVDVSRIVQKLFERQADLFPIRPQGGAYFCPACHAGFVGRIQDFLGRVGGRLWRFPVPAGTEEGDRSVKAAVAEGLAAAVGEHRAAVGQFGSDARPEALGRAAERIRATRFKLEAYAEYLAGERAALERALEAAAAELRIKVERLAGQPSPAAGA